jgi:hypothetical protein
LLGYGGGDVSITRRGLFGLFAGGVAAAVLRPAAATTIASYHAAITPQHGALAFDDLFIRPIELGEWVVHPGLDLDMMGKRPCYVMDWPSADVR